MNERQQRDQYLRAHLNLINRHSYLLEKSHPFIPVEQYLFSFHRELGYVHFLNYSFPWGYRLDFVDQFEDQIVNFCHSPAPDGSKVPYALVQVSKEFHFIAYFGYSPTLEEMLCHVNFFVLNPKDLKPFLDKNEKFIELQQSTPVTLGFTP